MIAYEPHDDNPHDGGNEEKSIADRVSDDEVVLRSGGITGSEALAQAFISSIDDDREDDERFDEGDDSDIPQEDEPGCDELPFLLADVETPDGK